MLFYRSTTHGEHVDYTEQLTNLYAGTLPSACWIMGGGPSLGRYSKDELQAINDSPLPKFAMNYSGRGKDGQGYLVKPTHWTSFDPTPRFAASLFLDPTIMKFVRSNREMDLVPASDEKLCDCPQTFFFHSEYKTYSNFFSPGTPINHSLDSFIQTLDIAFRLGFRRLYCIGCDMIVRPSEGQVELARKHGVKYENGITYRKHGRPEAWQSDKLRHFADECIDRGVAERGEIDRVLTEVEQREELYSCSEVKSFGSSASCDNHYWERIQMLRLSRRNMALNGIELVSSTPDSRLNAFFPVMGIQAVIERECPRDPVQELTVGRYTQPPLQAELPHHKDIKPYGYKPPVPVKDKKEEDCGCGGKKHKEEPKPVEIGDVGKQHFDTPEQQHELQAKVEALAADRKVEIQEVL